MYTVPLNIIQNFNANNIKNLTFGKASILPSGNLFMDDAKDVYSFSNKYEEIKRCNPDAASLIKMLQLDDDEYDMVMKGIYRFPKRENALLNKKASMKFLKEQSSFNGINYKNLNLIFSDQYGFFHINDTSNDIGNLHLTRETSDMDGKYVTHVLDKSRLNEEYYVKNSYKNTMCNSNGCKMTDERNISISDANNYPLLEYSYAKEDAKDYLRYNVCGRKYMAKMDNNGKVAIISGKNGKLLDFSNIISGLSRNKKDTFIEALKMLPPQILLELNDTFDVLSEEKSDKDFLINLYTPSVAAKEMVDYTIERLSRKNSLADNEDLKEIFKYERENFINWLNNDSDGQIIKGQDFYLKEYLEPDEEIMEVIKAVCNLLWMEEYEQGKASDEHQRLLLNFFPETVSFIVSRFELNNLNKEHIKV